MENRETDQFYIPLSLAKHMHDYMLLLGQAVYATGSVREKALAKLDGYGTPLVEYEKALGNAAICICGHPHSFCGNSTNWEMVCSKCEKPKISPELNPGK